MYGALFDFHELKANHRSDDKQRRTREKKKQQQNNDHFDNITLLTF